MADYHLLRSWRFDAPLDAVYAAIPNAPHWQDDWPGMQKVEEVAAGDSHGIGRILHYFWQGPLPYRMVFEARATPIEKHVAIEGAVRGDLEWVDPESRAPCERSS